jgi:hypothetical protein
MRRFEEASTVQLSQKLIAMRGSEVAQVLAEWLSRARESYRENLETIDRDQVAVNLLQGRLAEVKDILNLINP